MAPQNALRSSFGGWDAKQAYMFLLRARKAPVPGALSFPPAARSEASSKYTDQERLALRPAATGKSSRPARSQWRRRSRTMGLLVARFSQIGVQVPEFDAGLRCCEV